MHLSDQQVYCILRSNFYYSFDGSFLGMLLVTCLLYVEYLRFTKFMVSGLSFPSQYLKCSCPPVFHYTITACTVAIFTQQLRHKCHGTLSYRQFKSFFHSLIMLLKRKRWIYKPGVRIWVPRLIVWSPWVEGGGVSAYCTPISWRHHVFIRIQINAGYFVSCKGN